MNENLLPTQISHYRIVSKLGAGGMGEVYLAEDTRLRRQVALKVLPVGVAANRDRLLRFEREAFAASALNHPNILTIHEFGEDDSIHFLASELVHGETLSDRIRRAQLTLLESLHIAVQIASALQAAHDAGIVHRDIKPDNVMIRDDGYVKVLDFGLAKLFGKTSSELDHDLLEEATRMQLRTQAGMIVGTVAYMSPEQARGKEVDTRSDIWSLGCVLYEMLARQQPFTGETTTDTLASIIYNEPTPIVSLRPEAPPEFGRILAKALRKNKEERYQAIKEVLVDLKELQWQLGPGGSLPEQAFDPHTAILPSTNLNVAAVNNLPSDRTKFIGRIEELNVCADMLATSRIVTLTGLGGAGKTRLAIKLAERVAPSFLHGVCFVSLGPITEGNRVLGTVTQLLGVREEAEKDPQDLLGAHLSNKQMLLVLDNCEQVLAACRELVDQLLTTCAELRIVATSREGLAVSGERVFPVLSLGVPDVGSEHELRIVEAADAVQLFVDRAQMAQSGFHLSTANVAGVAEICRRLDGIPLAIELAAARVKLLSIEQIRSKLDDRFKLLSSTTATTLPRHKTLRATIEWSYEQLSTNEQRLLRLLSVFAGGWTLQLLTQVVGDADEFEIIDLLSGLVDKSLVVVGSEQTEHRRYRLLETVRQYAHEQLIDSGVALIVRTAHLTALLELAEHAYKDWITDEERASNLLKTENDNLRAALQFARTVDAEKYMSLVGALAWFWVAKSYLIEGYDHLTAALDLSEAQPARPARARTLWGAGHMLGLKGDGVKSRPLIAEALKMWRELGDTYELALALESTGWTQFMNGDDEAACSTFEECLELQLASGDANLINRARVGLAQVLVALNRTEEAGCLAAEILEFSKSHRDKRSEHFAWHYLADCALMQEKYEESLELYQKSLVLANALGDRIETSFEVQGVAMSLSGLGRSKESVQLAAAVKAEWERLGADLHVRFWLALLDHHIGKAKEDLGLEVSALTWEEGKSLSFEQAVALALEA